MTDGTWRVVIWSTLALSVMAHLFLTVDVYSINDLKKRVAELERKIDE